MPYSAREVLAKLLRAGFVEVRNRGRCKFCRLAERGHEEVPLPRLRGAPPGRLVDHGGVDAADGGQGPSQMVEALSPR